MGASQSGLVQRSASIETTKIADQALKRSFNAVDKQTSRCNQIEMEIKGVDKQIADLTTKKQSMAKSKAACLDIRSRMTFNAQKLKDAVTLGEKGYYEKNRNSKNQPLNGNNRNQNQNGQRRNNY